MPKTKYYRIEINFPQDITIHVYHVKNVLDFINNDLRKRWSSLPGRADDGPLDGIHICAYGPYPNTHWIVLEHGVDKFCVMHEVIHCVDRMMQWFGFEDTEFRAYMNELINKRILK